MPPIDLCRPNNLKGGCAKLQTIDLVRRGKLGLRCGFVKGEITYRPAPHIDPPDDAPQKSARAIMLRINQCLTKLTAAHQLNGVAVYTWYRPLSIVTMI